MYTGSFISWAGLFTICVTLYPTYIRATGQGWANALAKIGALIAPTVTGFLSTMQSGFELTIIIVTALLVICMCASFFFTEHKKSS